MGGSLLGSLFGGGSSSGSGGSLGGMDWGAEGGHAEGGRITGAGTSTSDSIFARLSNGEFVVKAKAVSHWGAGFFERLNNLQMPQMALANGGLVSSTMLMPPASASSGNFSDGAGAARNTNGGGNTYLTMHIHAKDANSFRLSQSQIMRDASREIDRQRLKQGN